MPNLHRFLAQDTLAVGASRLLLIFNPIAGPTQGQNTWHVVTLRAGPGGLIGNTGDTAIFYIGVGARPTGVTASGAFADVQSFRDRTYVPLPTQAWYPVGDRANPDHPGGLTIDIGEQLYAVVTGGTVGRSYFLSGVAVEFDP